MGKALHFSVPHSNSKWQFARDAKSYITTYSICHGCAWIVPHKFLKSNY